MDPQRKADLSIPNCEMLIPSEYSQRFASGNFQARLNRVAQALSSKGVLIGACDGAEEFHLSPASTVSERSAIGDSPVSVECLIKLFTAALTDKAVRAGEFKWNSQVSELFDCDDPIGLSVLHGITVKHLIEHTHGLDGSDLVAAPIDSAGFIDTAALFDVITRHAALAPPGRLYNYSSIGYWLAAAILERCHRTSYGQMLRAELLSCGSETSNALAIKRNCSSLPEYCCPALGGALALPLTGLLQFLAAQFLDSAAGIFHGKDFDQICNDVVPLPGWTPLESGVYLGWNYYGSGWFGHNSKSPSSTTLARVNPKLRKAIVVSSQDQSAVLIAATLFADLLPEFKTFKMPALLKAGMALDATAMQGVYGDSALSVAIEPGSPALELRAYRASRGTRAAEPFVRALLRAAAGGVFLTQPLRPDEFAYVQFVMPGEHGYEYLWNGSSLWRRQSSAIG